MAQSGYTPIQLYYSSTAAATPTSGNLAAGELALNITDGKLFYKDNGGTVQVLATAAGANGDVVGPGSSTDNALVRFDSTTGKLVQNSVGILSDAGALSGLTDISASGSVTLSGGTANGVAYLNGSKVLTTGSALTFDGTNLGIGTSSPAYKLDVAVATDSTAGLRITGGSYNATISPAGLVSNRDNVYVSASAGILNLTTTSALQLSYGAANAVVFGNGTERMRLDSSGNLGIGTSSPGYKLQVTTASSGAVSRMNYTGGSRGARIEFGLGETAGGVENYIDFSGTSGTSAGIFKASGAEVMRLSSSGNVGIGTSSPSQKLEVNGAALVNGTSGFIRAAITGSPASGAAALQISINSTNARTIRMENTISGGHTYDIINGAAGVAGNLGIYDDTAGAYRLTLDSSGNLGIGVTPSAWSNGKAIEVGVLGSSFWGYAQNETYMLSNTYFNGGWKYAGTGTATRYAQISGQHVWSTATSGTAGNAISFTQAMTLGSNGYLSVGDTSTNYPLTIKANGTNSYAPMLTINPATGTNASYIYMNNGGSGGFFVGRADSTGDHSGTRISAYDSFVWNTGAQNIVFGTNNTERARIDSSGKLFIGGTSMVESGFMLMQYSGATYNGLIFNDTDTGAAGNYFARMRRNGSVIGSISSSTTATSFNTSSDYRLKEDIQQMTGALAKVAALKPVTYKWKSDGSDGEGFIAHELAEVVPQCVTGEKDAVDAEGNPVYQGIDTSFLVATLTAAIQELKAEFDAYKATHP